MWQPNISTTNLIHLERPFRSLKEIQKLRQSKTRTWFKTGVDLFSNLLVSDKTWLASMNSLAISVTIIDYVQKRRQEVAFQSGGFFFAGEFVIIQSTGFVRLSAEPPNNYECISDQSHCVSPTRWIHLSDIRPGPRSRIQTKNRAKIVSISTTEVVEVASVEDSSIKRIISLIDQGFLNVPPIFVLKYFALFAGRRVWSYGYQHSWRRLTLVTN